MTDNIKIIGGNNDTKFCFKSSPFTRSMIHLNDTHIETSENIPLLTYHYNLIEYSDNYQDTAGSLYHFKRGEQHLNAAGNIVDVTTDNSSSFKYKSSLLTRLDTHDGGQRADAYRLFKNK